MSCSCSCCCEAPSRELLQGIRKKERLLTEEETTAAGGGGGGGGEEEQSRRNMDISLLTEEYRSSREKQRRHTQVLLFRKVSEELSDAISVVPVTQGLTPPAITFDPDPTTYDPWHVHLDLHRRSRSIVTIQLPVSSPETNTSIDSSSRHSWSSSSEACSSQNESRCRKLSVDSAPDSLRSSREMSPCSSIISKQENHFNIDRSRGDPGSERAAGDSFTGSKVDPVQTVTGSFSASEQQSREGPPDGSVSSSKEDSICSSFAHSQEGLDTGARTSSDESSTPVASITTSPSSSTTNLCQNLKETQSKDTKTSNSDLQPISTPNWRGSRKFSAPANRFTRQLSVEGDGSSTGVQQNQNFYPFPNRKTPRISEAARRLGMYSSF